jgi:hypothetical protein
MRSSNHVSAIHPSESKLSHEIYVSVDVEATGNCPPRHSMFSYGAVSWNPETGEHREFFSNVQHLPGSSWDEAARQLYSDELLKVLEHEPERPAVSMRRFNDWLLALGGRPIFVGYPASFDFVWIYWYLHNFHGRCPFGFQALDLKTAAWMLNATEFRKTQKASMPKRWFNPALVHTHHPLDDAKEQMFLFKSIREDRLKRIADMQSTYYPPVVRN